MRPIKMQSYAAFLTQNAIIFNFILLFIGLYAIGAYHYLLFHTLAELFSIAVAMATFMLAWNSRKYSENSYLLLLGIAYLFIGGLDLIHTLAYGRMNLFPGYDSNLSIQVWIAARYMESLSFLALALLAEKRLPTIGIFSVYLAAAIALLAAIFTHRFPDCFIEGVGLTTFKKTSEYIICMILIASLGLLTKRRYIFDPTVFQLLCLSIFFTIFSELAFTFYTNLYGLANIIGHLFKILSFYLIYKAIIVIGLENPFRLLFKNMKESRDAIKKIITSVSSQKGDRFFHSMVIQLAKILRADYTFIGEITEGATRRIRTIALCANGEIADNIEYDLKDTPCADVAGDNVCTYPNDVDDIFPKDALLRKMGVKGYVGTPLSGIQERPIGIMVALYRQPVENPQFASSILQVFAAQVGVEIDRTQTEKALQASKEKFETAITRAPIPMVMTDANQDILLYNDKFIESFGYTLEDISTADEWWRTAYPDESYRRKVQRAWNDAFYRVKREGGEFETQEWDLTIKDRSVRRVEFKITHLDDITLIAMNDITERKRAEQALFESEERLRTLINSVPDIICFKDGEGRWLIANEAYQEVFQLTEKDYVGKKGVELDQCTPSLADAAMGCESSNELAWKAGGITRGEEMIPHPDGSIRTYDIIKVPRFNPDGSRSGLVVFGRDVTERKQWENDLKNAQIAAEKANRLKSEFLANMSHEIRTPMNAVLGFADLLYSEITNPKHKNYLESIRVSGASLLSLIDDILDLSKIEAGKLSLNPETVDPHSIFEEIKQIFSLRIAEKNLVYIEEIANNIPRGIRLDGHRLRQTLLNLVGNAVKFTHKGHIKLTANMVTSQTDQFLVDLMVAVEDTGIGVPKEEQELIFAPFQQQDQQSTRKFGGTGLGLTITKRLVEMMNGEIQLHSQPGQGSTFKVILHDVRLEKQVNPDSGGDSTRLKHLVFKPATILVVDDIETNRILVKALLLDSNLTVFEATNGQEAVEQVRMHQPDLVLMDVRMPVMDGYQATKAIKNDLGYQYLPIIAVTAAVMNDEKEKIMDFGFDGFLQKPMQVDDLLAILKKYLTHSYQKPENQYLSTEETECLPPEAQAHLTALLPKLEGGCMRSWQEARESNDFSLIADFAEQIRQIGDGSNIACLATYGDELTAYCDAFDVDNIAKALEGYPNLIERLKQQLPTS